MPPLPQESTDALTVTVMVSPELTEVLLALILVLTELAAKTCVVIAAMINVKQINLKIFFFIINHHILVYEGSG